MPREVESATTTLWEKSPEMFLTFELSAEMELVIDLPMGAARRGDLATAPLREASLFSLLAAPPPTLMRYCRPLFCLRRSSGVISCRLVRAAFLGVLYWLICSGEPGRDASAAGWPRPAVAGEADTLSCS